MTTEQMIKMALSYAQMSQAELARRLNMNASNLYRRIKRNTLTREDIEKIASAIGCTFECHLVFPDGTKI